MSESSSAFPFSTLLFPLSSEFGFSLKLPNGSCGIAVNNGEAVPGERQLFTLCHEVGHLLMHHQDDDADDTPETKKRREKEANAFAAGMLIPTAEFISAWNNTEGRLWFDRRAFVAGDITMPRLAELLGKPLLETRTLVNEWAREAAE